MNWIDPEHLLRPLTTARPVTLEPPLDHEGLRNAALGLAAGLQQRGVRRLAVHLEDAADLAIALLGAWRAGVQVLLPADLQPQTRLRWNDQVNLWLTDQPGDLDLASLHTSPLAPVDLDPRSADARFNLAQTLVEMGRGQEAMLHWQAYLAADSGSTWADYARERLEAART